MGILARLLVGPLLTRGVFRDRVSFLVSPSVSAVYMQSTATCGKSHLRGMGWFPIDCVGSVLGEIGSGKKKTFFFKARTFFLPKTNRET